VSEWKFAGTFQYTGCSCHGMPQLQIRIYYRVFEDWLVIFDVWHKMVQAIYVVNLKSGQVAERIPDSQEQIEKFAAGQFDESDVKPFLLPWQSEIPAEHAEGGEAIQHFRSNRTL
jgi:hypothetical protein